MFDFDLLVEKSFTQLFGSILEYQVLYFDDELIKKDIQTLKKIEINNDKIVITNFTLQKK